MNSKLHFKIMKDVGRVEVVWRCKWRMAAIVRVRFESFNTVGQGKFSFVRENSIKSRGISNSFEFGNQMFV